MHPTRTERRHDALERAERFAIVLCALAKGEHAARAPRPREEHLDRLDKRLDEVLEPHALGREHDLRISRVIWRQLVVHWVVPIEWLASGGACSEASRPSPRARWCVAVHGRAACEHIRLKARLDDRRYICGQYVSSRGSCTQPKEPNARSQLDDAPAVHKLAEPRILLAE